MPSLHTTTSPTERLVGRCEACILPFAIREEGSHDYKSITCPECGGAVVLERVYGTRTSMACDASCEGAIGSLCVCACGGINHGGAFAREGEALASAIKDYRVKTTNRKAAAQKRAADRAEKKARTMAELAEARKAEELAFKEDHIDIWNFLVEVNGEGQPYNEFFSSVFDQWIRKGEISERQLDAVKRSIVKRQEFAAQREAEVRVPVAEGRQVIVGRVLKKEWRDDDYGGRDVITVKDDRGFVVWGTCPRSVDVEKGERIKFAATVTKSDRDESFGFFKRPTKAERVGEVA